MSSYNGYRNKWWEGCGCWLVLAVFVLALLITAGLTVGPKP